MLRLPVIAAAACLSMAATGCSSFFMVGADSAKKAPASAVARYKIPTCVNATTGDTMAGPATQTYYLVEKTENAGPALYELDEKGSGAKITNHWESDIGDHFATHVRTSHGWEYIVPKDRTQPGKRLVFVKRSYNREKQDDGTFRLNGIAIATCDMVPQTE